VLVFSIGLATLVGLALLTYIKVQAMLLARKGLLQIFSKLEELFFLEMMEQLLYQQPKLMRL